MPPHQSQWLLPLPWLLVALAALGCSEINPTGYSGATVLPSEDADEGPGDDGVRGAGGADSPAQDVDEPDALPPCSEAAEELFVHLNLFRQQNGLPAIEPSQQLCFVAETHVADLQAAELDEGCTENSWSSAARGGACCYAPDHSSTECMWEAPARLTDYEGTGYESVALNVPSVVNAFRSFRDDPGHRAMLLNEGQWSETTWLAVGAAYVDGYASLWLGDAVDGGSAPEGD